MKRLLILATILLGIPLIVYLSINSSAVQQPLIKFIGRTINWDIEFARLRWRPWPGRIDIAGLRLHKGQQTFEIEDVGISYSMLGLLRGKFVVPDLKVSDARISMGPSATHKSGPGKAVRLFFLQNIVIEDGRIAPISINLPKKEIKIEELSFSFNPSFLTRLGGTIEIKGVEGIDSFSAGFRFDDQKIYIRDFQLAKGGSSITGDIELNLNTKSYKVSLNIPEPFKFPKLGRSPTINTGGDITGKIYIEGSGLKLDELTGRVIFDLTHSASGVAPLKVAGILNIKNGVIELADTRLSINLSTPRPGGRGMLEIDPESYRGIKDGNIAVSGTVNIPGKMIDLKFIGDHVPLEDVFGRFEDENFHPIFGRADATAEFTGWGRNFNVTGEAKVVGQGGYYQITADDVTATVDVSYSNLHLAGEIKQGGRTTGEVDLNIAYGVKAPNQPRPKVLKLEASLDQHDLGQSLKDYGLAGIGSGHLTMKGPPRSYLGNAKVEIKNGSALGLAFNSVLSTFDLKYKNITFTGTTIDGQEFTRPVAMDLVKGGFNLSGSPRDGVSINLTYKDRVWHIDEIEFEGAHAKGSLGASANLDISGQIDLASLKAFRKYVRDGQGPADINLKISGPKVRPELTGSVSFQQATLYLVSLPYRLESLKGALKLERGKVSTEGLTGLIDGGKFTLAGSVEHTSFKPKAFNLSLNGQDLRWVPSDRSFKMEFNTSATLVGPASNPMLSGNIYILDGKYTKDFKIFEKIAGKKKEVPRYKMAFGARLNLYVKTTGDLAIRNNVGDIFLKMDSNITGTLNRPVLSGIIEVVEGRLHYLGQAFEITSGFAELREPHPYLEVTGQREVGTYNVIVSLSGTMDNLNLELSSTPPLEKRDIVSLLAFGATEEELRQMQWSGTFGTQVVASEISQLIERPVTKITHLDIFRLEALPTPSDSSTTAQHVSKLYLGKQVTDRLRLEFVTDINVENAQEMIQAEYLLTDFLLLKASRVEQEKYKLNILFRFRER